MRNININIVIFTFARIILNTAHRMVYPFLGTFRDSLGVTLPSLSLLLTVKSLVGASGPLLATISDNRGRKIGMILGLVIFTTGAMVIIFLPNFHGFAIAILLTILGKVIFDPSMHAYLGDQVPYQLRGKLMAISEFGWSLSFIIGVPLVGLSITLYGWLGPFPFFVILGSITTLFIYLSVKETNHNKPINYFIFHHLTKIISNNLATAGLLMSVFLSMANEVVNLVFGIWLEDSFGIRIAALGVASAIIGFSELGGESLVAIYVDRIGKSRAVVFGLSINCLAAFLLPYISWNIVGTMIGLFLFYISFEFALVSSIPLMSEIVPSARATMISSNAAAHSLGRAVGALIAVPLYSLGIRMNTSIAILCNLISIAALFWLVQKSDFKL